jgi:hypothetical protein
VDGSSFFAREHPVELVEFEIHPALAAVLRGLEKTRFLPALQDRVEQLLHIPASPSGDKLESALAAHLWILRRAGDDGIPLTKAGYLPPALVREFAPVVPMMADWHWGIHREDITTYILHFRTSLMRSGLLRKYKGHLRATKVGKAARDNPQILWSHLVSTLIPGDSPFSSMASALVALHYATTADERLPVAVIAEHMSLLGFRDPQGGGVEQDDIWWYVRDVWDAIGNVGQPEFKRGLIRAPSPEARALIRDSLIRQVPGVPDLTRYPRA